MGRSSSATRTRTVFPSIEIASFVNQETLEYEENLYPNQHDQDHKLLPEPLQRQKDGRGGSYQRQTLDNQLPASEFIYLLPGEINSSHFSPCFPIMAGFYR
jgi:hypothetical protein